MDECLDPVLLGMVDLLVTICGNFYRQNLQRSHNQRIHHIHSNDTVHLFNHVVFGVWRRWITNGTKRTECQHHVQFFIRRQGLHRVVSWSVPPFLPFLDKHVVWSNGSVWRTGTLPVRVVPCWLDLVLCHQLRQRLSCDWQLVSQWTPRPPCLAKDLLGINRRCHRYCFALERGEESSVCPASCFNLLRIVLYRDPELCRRGNVEITEGRGRRIGPEYTSLLLWHTRYILQTHRQTTMQSIDCNRCTLVAHGECCWQA